MNEDQKIVEFRQLGLEHLKRTKTSVAIKPIGDSGEGQEIYGIHLQTENDDEWYNDSSEGMLAWKSEQEASKYLQNYVLPNLGLMSVLLEHRKKIRAFQMMLNCEASATGN